VPGCGGLTLERSGVSPVAGAERGTGSLGRVGIGRQRDRTRGRYCLLVVFAALDRSNVLKLG